MVTPMKANKTGGGSGTNQYAVKGKSRVAPPSAAVAPQVTERLRAQADAMAGHRPPVSASLDDAIRLAASGDDEALNAAFNPSNGPRAYPHWFAHDIHGPLNDDSRPSVAVRAAADRVAAGHAVRIVVSNEDDGSYYMPFDTDADGALFVVQNPSGNHDPCNRCGADARGNGRTLDDCDLCRTDIQGPDEKYLDPEDEDDLNTVELAAARRAISDDLQTRA